MDLYGFQKNQAKKWQKVEKSQKIGSKYQKFEIS